MAKREALDESLARSAKPLYEEIRAVLESARGGAYRAVNAAMVQAYWHVGRLIVEHEQGGAKRAAYGEAVLEELSRRLTTEFGRGFDVTNLRKMRQFYRIFEIRDAVRLESGDETKRDAARLVSPVEMSRHTASDDLSWSHFRLLMQVEDPAAREWYMREAAKPPDLRRQVCEGPADRTGAHARDRARAAIDRCAPRRRRETLTAGRSAGGASRAGSGEGCRTPSCAARTTTRESCSGTKSPSSGILGTLGDCRLGSGHRRPPLGAQRGGIHAAGRSLEAALPEL